MAIGFTNNKQADKSDTEKADVKNASYVENEQVIPEFEDLTSPEEPQTGSKNNLVFVFIVAVLIVVIFLIISLIKKSKNNTNNVDYSDVATTEAISMEDEDDSGDTEERAWHTAEGTSADVPISSESEYVTDLEGESLESNYDVVDTSYFKDFANYEMKRASIDDGMEMYWLEITYQGKKYRCQIPYYAATNMQIHGICVVEIEQLQLANGGTVISYMQVVYDYENMLTGDEE